MEQQHSHVHYIGQLPASGRYSMIMARLGYRKYTTRVDEAEKETIDGYIRHARLLCKPKGAWARLKITDAGKDYVTAEDIITLKSEGLANLLGNSRELIFMASTAGKEITEAISKEMQEGNPAAAVVMDSTASQTADAGLDWIVDFLNKLLKREGKRLTRYRFSPGYGDLSLACQKIIFDRLELNRIGLALTDKYMLVPEKSVIAIAGIEEDGWDERK